MQGIITLTKTTANHRAALESKGYEVTEGVREGKNGEQPVLLIETTGFHTDPVDLSTEEGKETVRSVVANKQLFTYRTRFTMPTGETVFGLAACRKLGPLSALIAKNGAPKTKKPAVSDAMNSILEDLGF